MMTMKQYATVVAQDEDAILSIQDVHIRYRTVKGNVQAIRGVDLAMAQGESLALIGWAAPATTESRPAPRCASPSTTSPR